MAEQAVAAAPAVLDPSSPEGMGLVEPPRRSTSTSRRRRHSSSGSKSRSRKGSHHSRSKASRVSSRRKNKGSVTSSNGSLAPRLPDRSRRPSVAEMQARYQTRRSSEARSASAPRPSRGHNRPSLPQRFVDASSLPLGLVAGGGAPSVQQQTSGRVSETSSPAPAVPPVPADYGVGGDADDGREDDHDTTTSPATLAREAAKRSSLRSTRSFSRLASYRKNAPLLHDNSKSQIHFSPMIAAGKGGKGSKAKGMMPPPLPGTPRGGAAAAGVATASGSGAAPVAQTKGKQGGGVAAWFARLFGRGGNGGNAGEADESLVTLETAFSYRFLMVKEYVKYVRTHRDDITRLFDVLQLQNALAFQAIVDTLGETGGNPMDFYRAIMFLYQVQGKAIDVLNFFIARDGDEHFARDNDPSQLYLSLGVSMNLWRAYTHQHWGLRYLNRTVVPLVREVIHRFKEPGSLLIPQGVLEFLPRFFQAVFAPSDVPTEMALVAHFVMEAVQQLPTTIPAVYSIGMFVMKRFISQCIRLPEQYKGVAVDTKTVVISKDARTALMLISEALAHLATGTQFDSNSMSLRPVNTLIAANVTSYRRWAETLAHKGTAIAGMPDGTVTTAAGVSPEVETIALMLFLNRIHKLRSKIEQRLLELEVDRRGEQAAVLKLQLAYRSHLRHTDRGFIVSSYPADAVDRSSPAKLLPSVLDALGRPPTIFGGNQSSIKSQKAARKALLANPNQRTLPSFTRGGKSE